LVLVAQQPLRCVEARESRDEVVHGPGAVDDVLHLLGEVVVGGRHVGPHGVASERRHLAQLENGSERRPFAEGDVGVPDVLERRDGPARLVEADDVLAGAGGEQGVGLQLAPVAREGTLLVGGEVLRPEEQHLPLQQGPVELVAQRGTERPRQVDALDDGADRARLGLDVEQSVRPLRPALGQAAQYAPPLVHPVARDARLAQSCGRAGVRHGHGVLPRSRGVRSGRA
jgi:hypothetical protein